MIFKVEYTAFGHTVCVSTNSHVLFSRIKDIIIDVEEELPVVNQINVYFTVEDNTIEIKNNEKFFYHGDDLDALTLQLDLLISHLLIKNTQQAIRLHGGCAEVKGNTVIITGDKTAGKTTLLLNLMLDGNPVYCDENIIFNDLHAMPFPRKFHIKDGSLELLPHLANYVKKLRKYPYHLGGHFRFFDPTDANKPWIIKNNIPSNIIFIKPAFGKPSRILKCGKIEMLENLTFQTTNYGESPDKQINLLTELVNSCECSTLYLGDVGSGTKLIYDLVG